MAQQGKNKKRSKSKSKGLSFFDYFGHPISLNFDGQGNSFKTNSGGFVTITVMVALFVYFVYMIHEMVDQQPQSINSYSSTIDVDVKHSYSME